MNPPGTAWAKEAEAATILRLLEEAMLDVFGPSVAGVVMFRLGEKLGIRVKPNPRLSSEVRLASALRSIGYGELVLAHFNPYTLEGRILVKSVTASPRKVPITGEGGSLSCYLYRGVITGVLHRLFKVDVLIREVKCGFTSNSPYCEYYFKAR